MVITVQCPSCATSFPVDTAKIPERGVSARCSACTAIFRVERPAEQPEAIGVEEGVALAGPLPSIEAMPPADVEEEATAEQETLEEPLGEPVHTMEEAPGSAADEAVAEPWDEATVVEPSDDATVGEVDAEEEAAVVEVEAEEDAVDTASDHEWAVEMQEDLDTSSLEVTPMETVESTVEETRDKMSEGSFSWEPAGFETSEDLMEEAAQTEEEPHTEEEPQTEEEEASEAAVFEVSEPAVFEAPDPAAFETAAPVTQEPELEPPAPQPEPAKGFKFGHRDPHDKARRLARVLVSDMIMYNPDRHARALEGGTLKADFEDEIQKSWKEYVDQVGEEIANSTTYWPDALNDILAKGQQVF